MNNNMLFVKPEGPSWHAAGRVRGGPRGLTGPPSGAITPAFHGFT